MIKIDLARILADKSGVSQREADTFLSNFIDIFGEALEKGEKVQLAGFGVFGIRYLTKHQGRNPKTGKLLMVPACHYPIFKAGKGLKDRVAKVQLAKHPYTAPNQAESTPVKPKPERKKKTNSAS